jgi:hypothetical protein
MKEAFVAANMGLQFSKPIPQFLSGPKASGFNQSFDKARIGSSGHGEQFNPDLPVIPADSQVALPRSTKAGQAISSLVDKYVDEYASLPNSEARFAYLQHKLEEKGHSRVERAALAEFISIMRRDQIDGHNIQALPNQLEDYLRSHRSDLDYASRQQFPGFQNIAGLKPTVPGLN